MSIVGGFMAVPLFLIMHLISGDSSLTSFMGIIDTARESNFDFYTEMFNNRWESILIVIALCILYTLKPITATNFVLSISNTLTYVAVEITAKIVFIFLTMIAVESKTDVSTMEATGLSLALLS